MKNPTTTLPDTKTKIFSASLAGFSDWFYTLDEVREWAKGIDAEYGVSGQALKISEGYEQGTLRVIPQNCPHKEVTV